MTVSVHPEASAEFLEAIAYYEERQAGLGLDLASEVKTAIERVVASPEGWPAIEGPIRRCLVPYAILYFIEPAGIRILAVMHLHRSPDYWKHRQQG
jgi:plasmid stabilization system protein ParE